MSLLHYIPIMRLMLVGGKGAGLGKTPSRQCQVSHCDETPGTWLSCKLFPWCLTMVIYRTIWPTLLPAFLVHVQSLIRFFLFYKGNINLWSAIEASRRVRNCHTQTISHMVDLRRFICVAVSSLTRN